MDERLRGRRELGLLSAWAGEYFARQQRLPSPQQGIDDLLSSADPAAAEAIAEAQFHQMAAAWGLEVEEAGEGED